LAAKSTEFDIARASLDATFAIPDGLTMTNKCKPQLMTS